MLPPGAIAVSGPVLVILTSACVSTLVVTWAVLFPAVVSVGDVIVAVSVMVVFLAVLELTLTTNEKLALAPLASEEMEQFPVLGVQVKDGPVFCVIETNVVLAGAASVSWTLSAGSGPALLTVIE